jgi:lipoprotein-anchoring transpeptidase ErfK/SrfK
MKRIFNLFLIQCPWMIRRTSRKMQMRCQFAAAACAGFLALIYSAELQATAYNYDFTQQSTGNGSGPNGDGRPKPLAPSREIVAYSGQYRPGTIVVSTAERRLYYILPGNQAVKYGVGVGRPGFEWHGQKTVAMKREWPSWTPPAQMLKRRPDLPRYMPGGPENPLGARAMYLGGTLYRIHGSNEPDTIGTAVSSGCIRMTNEDVVDLYDRVKVGARVIVQADSVAP